MAKEINYDSLKVNMKLQVKYDFENDNIKYKKGERLTIVSLISLDNKYYSVIVSKDGKKIKLSKYEINTWFKLAKSKNVILYNVVTHSDVSLAIRNDKTIIVILETEFKGVATCDEESIFSEFDGYQIAYLKAKKKEANHRYKADRNECRSIIKAAQMRLKYIEKNYFNTERNYDNSIRLALAAVKVKQPF